MPDEPQLPPPPDALRKPQPADAPARRRTLDPAHLPADTAPAKPQQEDEDEEEEPRESQASGLGDMDATHVLSGVLGSVFGRPVLVIASAMLARGLVGLCEHAHHFLVVQFVQGSTGIFRSMLLKFTEPPAEPGWFLAGDSIALYIAFLLFMLGGLIVAVRSEIHILKLSFITFIVASIHALHSSDEGMKSPFSLMLWAGMLIGCIWLYRRFWKLQEPEEEVREVEEDEEAEEP